MNINGSGSIVANPGTMHQGIDKSRNGINSSKTQSESILKGVTNHGSSSKGGSRPITANNYVVVPSSQSKMVTQASKRKSGAGFEPNQSRNAHQVT